MTRRNVCRPSSSFLIALTETPDRNESASTDQFSMVRAAAQWTVEKDSGKSSMNGAGLAINQHTDPNSDEEHALKRLLDHIVADNAQ